MQTFLPYPDFKRSASILDMKRLGKQRVEAWQIYRALTEPDYGWQNHPAVKMWKGFEASLLRYGSIMCQEWIERGYNDTMLTRFTASCGTGEILGTMGLVALESVKTPPWLGNPEFHSSHRAALLAKNPEHYGELDWIEEPMDLTLKPLPYHWPVEKLN